MARLSPVLAQLRELQPLVETYGPTPPGLAPVELVQTFGPIEAEYASIRKGCVILDQPHRAVIIVQGADRLAFLNRMLTQELKHLAPGSSAASFWLSRKGRIDADLRVIALPDRILLDADVYAAPTLVAGLSPYIVADDVTLTDATEAWHRLALHGPLAPATLAAACEPACAPAAAAIAPGGVARLTLAGVEVVAFRDDATGAPGIELAMPAPGAQAVYAALITLPRPPRPAGWAARNIARIEAGTPEFLLDFGPDSLPAETGVISQRVSFTKGCYLGQEIVARMHALGHPKQVLVALALDPPPGQAVQRIAADNPADEAPFPEPGPQPVTADPIWALPTGADAGVAPAGEPVGRITSSAFSPMLGNIPVCFAMMKWGHHTPGTRLAVSALGIALTATVRPQLRFLP